MKCRFAYHIWLPMYTDCSLEFRPKQCLREWASTGQMPVASKPDEHYAFMPGNPRRTR